MLVFGQGRNAPMQGGPNWDELNANFNAAVASALDAGGRRVMPMTASAVQIDPEAAGVALLQEADRLRCATLAETAVFADDQGTLVLRLRIGTPVFVTQRDLDLKALLRIKLDLVGQQMAAEYLQHDRR